MTEAKLLHCLKIKQIKQSEHFGPYRGLGFLPDVRAIASHYSLSCTLPEMEEHHSSLSFSKGPRKKRQSLQLISACSRSQPLLHPQHNYSLQAPSSPSTLATGPLRRLATFKAAEDLSHPGTTHPGCSYPPRSGLHQLISKDTIIARLHQHCHRTSAPTTTGLQLVSVVPLPKWWQAVPRERRRDKTAEAEVSIPT